MDYLKKAWKVSGSLPKKGYLTIYNIIWTVVMAFVLLNQLAVFGQLPREFAASGFLYTLKDLIEGLLIIAIEIVCWYANVRFNPFIVGSASKRNDHAVQRAINRGKQAYSDTVNNGPVTTYEKKNPFGGDEKVTAKVKTNIWGDPVIDGKVESNWKSETESSGQLKYRAATEGITSGAASLLQDYVIKPGGKFLLWIIGFIVGWFSIKPYVKAKDNHDLLRGKQ